MSHYGYVSEQLLSRRLWPARRREPAPGSAPGRLDVERVRSHFDFPRTGRVVTNNAATSQVPRELIELYGRISPWYESVHRGQSAASRRMTAEFEESFDTIATWVNAPSRRCLATYRNTTEAINSVMYSLLTEFRDGDNVVTTLMEHNSNFVPWYALAREVLPRLGRRVECRVVRFDHETGELDLDHLAELVDDRTKLVCVTGASNFLGTKPPLHLVRRIADESGYLRPDGASGSLLLVDAAQLAPSSVIDVVAMEVDYLAFSFHKLLAPFGVGLLYAREPLLESSLPFLYGGDMIAEGRVSPHFVEYNELPWKYAAGTPNVLGVIASAQALRLLVDLALDPAEPWFGAPGRSRGRGGGGHGPGLDARARPDRRGAPPGPGHRGAPGLRTRTRRAAVSAVGVHGPRSRPSCRGPGTGRARGRGARGLPLRDPGPPGAPALAAGELPPQLRRLHQPRRRRPRARRPRARCRVT